MSLSCVCSPVGGQLISKYDRLRKTIVDLVFFPTFGIGLKIQNIIKFDNKILMIQEV